MGDWVPVRAWHRAVNDRDIAAARSIVADDVVMGGPRGQVTGVDVFIEWIGHAGILLTPRSWHPINGETVVVEQDASWPGNPEADADPVRVATLFRLSGDRVTAALRFDNLQDALAAATA